MVATDFFLNAMKKYKAKQLQKEAVTYEDMRDFVERMERSGRVINKDFVDISREHPGDIGRVSRFYTEGDMYEKVGPSALPKRQAKVMGYDPKYHNKIFMTPPNEAPHLYGPFVEKGKEKELTALKGYFLNHELHELKAGNKPRTDVAQQFGHMSLGKVLGRADNNFMAAAEDDVTRRVAEHMKDIRRNRMEELNMRTFDLMKPKALQRLEGQKVNPGIARLSKIERGESVAPIETVPSGFRFGERKISRKEALARHYKELGFDPNYALNPANRDEIRAWEKERVKLENDILRRQFETQKNLVNRQQRILEEEKSQLQQPKPQLEEPLIKRDSNIENKRKFSIAKTESPKKASLLDRVKKLNLLEKAKKLFRR